MNIFRVTTHLSEILEESQKQPVVIFKYSSECESSSRLYKKFEEIFGNKKNQTIIYLVTVQKEVVLSNKIEEMFDIKHESPQVIVIDKRKVTYSADHNSIDIENML